jgi:activator of HSP90 ATPase
MTIHHEVTLPASPDRVYAVLTTGALFTEATGGRTAEIGASEGAAFSLFGGAIQGRVVELVPGQRIVQAWRPQPWPAGHYSLVRFTLTRDGSGTRLALDHDGYPAEQHDHLSAGWATNYFEPLKTYLA